ncbi:LuxR C-terminal-related transcriptional regulator [Xylophilus sp. ASV27]|uniref:LuxR C-terminal-related transcriptional regulator n=1 Tax=Xylophilus sp. ASV27 TaxID=2795129 RepID=UPI0018EB0BF7
MPGVGPAAGAASRAGPSVVLSGRVRETLEMITKGSALDEIAAYMQAAPHTVQTCGRRIHSKPKASSRAGLLHEARQLGLLPP